MRLRNILVLAIACLSCYGDLHGQDSLWTFSGGPIFLHRGNPDYTPLFVDQNGVPLCFASDFDFGYETGLDVALRRFLSPRSSLEVRYFGVDDWSASKQIVNQSGTTQVGTNPPSGGGEPDPPPPSPFISDAFAIYSSSLDSVEINFRQTHVEGIDFLIGFRWIELGEMINTRTRQTMVPDQDTVGIFDNDVNNHLYGVQCGVDGTIRNSGVCWINAFAKAGIYGNSADQSAKYISETYSANSWWNHASGSDATFVGEIAFSLGYQVCNWLTVKLGYEALWISSVALASNQIPITPTTNHYGNITLSNGVFYHGGLLQLIFGLPY